ncbi:hypothetical protein [Bradyrhizobium sp. USDA 10063]
MTKTEKLLANARADLAVANEMVAALDAQKADAIRSSKTYAMWRLPFEEASLECERLGQLVATLEVDLQQEQAETVKAALASRRAELERQSAALASRIAKDGAAAAAVLVRLAEEARANAAAVERFNREASDDVAPLFSADQLARYRDPAPREDLEESIVDLWTFEATGELVSDQDAVVERDYFHGRIPAIPGNHVSNHPTHVVRKRFRQLTYLEADEREYFNPLTDALRLPRFDGPGMLFDRGRAVEPAQRRELIELLPVDGAPAQPAAAEAA